MIRTFGNKTAEDIYNGVASKEARKLPRELHGGAVRKLDMIDAAIDVTDLRVPPGNHLEKLKGDRSGQYSIRINDQYRICFHFDQGNATNVEIVDYH